MTQRPKVNWVDGQNKNTAQQQTGSQNKKGKDRQKVITSEAETRRLGC